MELNISCNALETMVAMSEYRKVCTRWVPRMFTQEHKEHRMQVCQDQLNQYEAEGDSFLDRSSKAALQSNTALVASNNQTMGAHSHRLCGSTFGKALPHHCGCLLKVPKRSFQCPTQHPGRQWQYSINCAPNMAFQRQSSATKERSLPHMSSGSSARLTSSVTFCHHHTSPNQMVRLNALSTPSSLASSN